MYWVNLFLTVFLFGSGITSVAVAGETCKISTEQWSKMEIRSVDLTRADGEAITIRSRIARSSAQRAAGYQHICPEIVALSSILFVYESPLQPRFHMFNVHVELDIGFFDQDKKLVTVLRMTPQTIGDASAEMYDPGQLVQYALEAPAGFFTDNKLLSAQTTLRFP